MKKLLSLVLVKDIGAARARYLGSKSWYTMNLVDYWWVCEVSAGEYQSSNKLVELYGENDSWSMKYIDGMADYFYLVRMVKANTSPQKP